MFKIVNHSKNLLRLGNFLQSANRVVNEPKLLKISINLRLLCSETVPQGPDISSIANGDKDLEHKLKILILEVDVMRQEGRLVPEDNFLKNHHWQELLKLPTISSRRRYLEFLFKTSKKKENEQLKKEKKRQEALQNKPERKPREEETFEDFVHTYDLSHNNIFLRFYDTTINQLYNNRLIQAMQFGQKLVIDCGYDQQMTSRENKHCAKQLMLLFAENRNHDDPFDLHFCNANLNSQLIQALHRFIPTMYEPWFPFNIHQSNYLELFPKEQLVYLTPHCREELIEYDHDAIYIIGGIVDVMNNEPLSLARAKKDGIKMAKFPLDRYLQWGAGSGKSLTLNQVTSILLDIKATNDWKYALRHVPRRKVVDIADQKHKRIWTPNNKIDFESLSFKAGKKRKDNNRRVTMRSIMYD